MPDAVADRGAAAVSDATVCAVAAGASSSAAAAAMLRNMSRDALVDATSLRPISEPSIHYAAESSLHGVTELCIADVMLKVSLMHVWSAMRATAHTHWISISGCAEVVKPSFRALYKQQHARTRRHTPTPLNDFHIVCKSVPTPMPIE